MNNTINIITPPDDIQLDALRILTYDLAPEQSQLISDVLSNIDSLPNIIIYVAKSGQECEWVVDKKHKSSIIISNAHSQDQTMFGYLLAQQNSYYFGQTGLQLANKNEIMNIEQINNILEIAINTYGI
jgi:hypothetical protein|tara:strand:- start:270 stop:653 length:384 start_codon:yes stop_codon:yes gene_type:complete